MNNWNPETYLKAWNFATKYHEGQTYGGIEQGSKVDYLNHIGAVAMEVIRCLAHTSNEYDAELAIQCALLHDTIEDTEATYETIQGSFGTSVADGVLALTKDESISNKLAMMHDSLDRILLQSPEIAMVKVADRICNLFHPPFYWTNDKIDAYAKEAQLIYERLTPADALLRERLREKIAAYPEFKRSVGR